MLATPYYGELYGKLRLCCRASLCWVFTICSVYLPSNHFLTLIVVMFHTRHLPLTPACLTSFARFKRPCRRNATYLMPTLRSSSHESLPRIAQPSFWQSMIPKFLRGSDLPATPAKLQRFKEWNPATFFIIIFLLIGSNAIQMIALQNDFKNFSRKADAKIGLLQDAIERLKRGEVADIEKLLGSGDEQNERDWEDGKSPASSFRASWV